LDLQGFFRKIRNYPPRGDLADNFETIHEHFAIIGSSWE
jgi:hypothetical protein